MYYLKKKNPSISALEKTYTELEESQYNNGKIYLEKKKYITFFMMFALAALLLSIANNLLEAKDGAGDNWSCSYCGYSNKFYEMSCRNCGKWR